MVPLPSVRRFAAVVTGCALLWLTADAAAPTALRVHAGSRDRINALVPFTLPSLGAGQTYELRDPSGALMPIQVGQDGRAWFVLPRLSANEERVFTIRVRNANAPPKVTVTSTGSDLAVSVADRPALTYIGGAGRLPSADIKPVFQRGGYIHAVRTPAGHVVTDDYPADHRHQHDVMFAWTSAEFEGRKTDFWNMGNALARVEAAGIDRHWSGPVHGGWIARHRYVDLTSGGPRPVLNETWTSRVYAIDGVLVFDVDIHQTPATPAPLVLPEYHYGGMAVRGAAGLIGPPERATVVTSEGKDRAGADNARARWAHIGGLVNGAAAGIAMLGHPDNFRAPEPMRVHPVDPYICFVPSRLGGWSITVEQPFTAKYRFVAADGPADAALLERLWRDFADPPRVTVQ